jgi:putative membrane-bound dehydrogenase-like protein
MIRFTPAPRLRAAMSKSLLAALLFGIAPFASGQEGNFPVATTKGLTPEEAAKKMTLPPGFRATPFAGEPAVHQPIAFTIDERGRLWVVENYAYPHWSPYGKDRILILEDTDGDGIHDKSTVFYDQLNFASGIAVGHGGVFVGSPPYLLFIPDKNRDDVPDGPPETLLDGWGHEDTHETLNSFIWGPDGWLYGNQGVFTHSNVGKPGARDNERSPLNACVWRYHPTKKIFEVFAEGMSNQWGLDFNDVGDSFVTACVIPHLYHVVQGAHYQRQAGQHFNLYAYTEIKTIADHAHYDKDVKWSDARFGAGGTDAAGGGHAHAGTLIYLGDNFPPEYRGTLLTHNVLGSRINSEKLTANGSGYIGSHGPDFMKANDAWFRGLRLEIGPDGSLFNSDWYDARACHQQHPQDRTNGRIYKISYGEPKRVQVDLAKLSSAELVQHQLHANEWFVRRSRLILQERGPNAEVHAALLKIVRENPDVTRQLRALWALHATRGLNGTLALELLKSREAYVRAWTIQLMSEDKNPSPAVVSAFAALAKSDPSPVVRRFLASAARRIAVEQRWGIVEALLQHGEDANDHNLPALYWFAAEPLVAADTARATALGNATPITSLRALFTKRQGALAVEGKGVAGKGSALDPLVRNLASTDDPSYQLEILDSLTSATEGKTKVPQPGGWGAAYAKLSASPDPKIIARADSLAARFGDNSIAARKRLIVTDTFAPLAARQAALEVMMQQRNFQLAPVYHKLLPEPGLRMGALRALAPYDVPATAPAVLAVYSSFMPEEKRQAINLLAQRAPYARELLSAVKAGHIPRTDLDASLARQLRLFNDPELNQAIADTWGVVRESAAETAQEIAKWKTILTPQRLAAANPSKGRAVFAKTCAQCHVLFDEGAKIGPELTGSNRGELDYILNNVVDPNAIIGKDYQLTTIETNDGRTAAGIVQRETPAAVTIVNMAETVTIARENIKKLDRHEMSLMPPGLFQAMKEDEVADLVAYLRGDRQVEAAR